MTDSELLAYILSHAQFDPFNGHFELPYIPAAPGTSVRDAIADSARVVADGPEQ